MDFKKYFHQSAEQIDQELELFLKDWVSEVAKVNPKLKLLVELFANSCTGGKRIRGILVKLGYEMAQLSLNTSDGGKVKRSGTLDSSEVDFTGNDIIKVAAAYEIFQTAILAHDDVIDESLLRRGQPTIYKALGGDTYAIAQAISLGDLGFFTAVKIITETKFSAEVKNRAIRFFSNTMMKTALGEMLDVELPHLDDPRREQDVLTIHKLKTAYYTISGPLILGGILGGLGELGRLEEFGKNLGIAFQIQDDILGVFGDEGQLGKSVTSDIEEGKNTLLITKALEKANDQQKEVLNRYYGVGKISATQFQEIKQIFIDTKSLAYSQQQAQKYVELAKKVIPEITADKVFGKILEELADYLVRRNK